MERRRLLAIRSDGGEDIIVVDEYDTNGFTHKGRFMELFVTSSQTILRALHAKGLHHRRSAKKPFLTNRHKQEWLRFAWDYLDFYWNTTIFSDEKTFKSSQMGRLHLWRKDNTHCLDKKYKYNKLSLSLLKCVNVLVLIIKRVITYLMIINYP